MTQPSFAGVLYYRRQNRRACFYSKSTETFAKPISLHNKGNRYRVGFPAHQPPDRAEFSLISINN